MKQDFKQDRSILVERRISLSAVSIALGGHFHLGQVGGLALCVLRSRWTQTRQTDLIPVQRSISSSRERSQQLTYSLLSLLGDGGAGSLDGASSVTEELGVDTEERAVSLSLGLLDAVLVGFFVLVVGRMVLRLCHPFSIYYADYIK